MQALPVTGVVVARNEAERIARCVSSLATLCTEVLVLDSGSTDATVAIAREAGAHVHLQGWLGFSAQKNAAIARATQPWVLLLDADEWLTAAAQQRLRKLFDAGTDGAVPIESADVWRMQRRTHFLGTPLRFGGWGLEAVERLFRNDLRYLPAKVHERLDLAGRRVRRVAARIEHDTARSHAEYVAKLSGYAALWAEQNAAHGRRAGATAAAVHAAAYWLKNYVLRGGFLDGAGGWRYHVCHTRYVHAKYARLHEISLRHAQS